MPAVEVQMVPPVEEAPTKTTVGIIYPPPEVRNIVDKTANFVARNGPEFETRIRQNEINNPKFNFLNPADPYHAYYQHKVKDFREGKVQELQVSKSSHHAPSRQQQQQEVVKAAELIVPKEPPPEFEFIADPPSISAFDLDVVKLTAQFVARNGRQFLTNLMNREQRNYQFDFLRPQHSLFNYFTRLVEQYTKILIPPKDLLNKLKKECDNPQEILDQSQYRVEWARYQERERLKEEAAAEKERVSYAQIDWHDFVVVETVDFQPSEQGNLPPPTTPEEVGARLLAQERFDTHGNDVEMDVSSEEEGEGEDEEEEGADEDDGTANTQVQDMEQGSSDEGEDEAVEKQEKEPREKASQPPLPPLPSQPPPLPPAPDHVIVRKDYNPKAPKPVAPSASAPDQFLVSPITGEKIAADKLQEHMRIGLLDPKWIEQRDRSIAEKREQEEVYAPGSAIESSLKQLAERRTDIFGVGAEEAQIGKKIGEEEIRPKEKLTWDGHTASMEKVSQKARENITIEDQIRVIQMAKGFIDDETKERIGPAIPKTTAPTPVHVPKPLPPRPPMSVPHPMIRPPHAPPQPRMPMMVPMAPQPRGMVLLPPRPPMPHPPMQPRPQLVAGPPMGMMARPPGLAPPPRPMPPKPMPEEPPSKRQKTEESLIPEDQFLRMNPSPVTFKVAVPSMPDKPEWKLAGQTLTLSLPLTDNVSVIKAKLNEELGMPAGKQKLQYEGLFIKDSNTLAYYNFNGRAVVSLQLKERGGRKK